MLEVIVAALFQSHSMKTDTGICHISIQQTNIHQVCLHEPGVATIEYKDGTVQETAEADVIKFINNI